jgi:hypothetical protein
MASDHAGDNESTWKNLEANKKDMNYGEKNQRSLKIWKQQEKTHRAPDPLSGVGKGAVTVEGGRRIGSLTTAIAQHHLDNAVAALRLENDVVVYEHLWASFGAWHMVMC